MLNQTPPERLADAAGRPYFLWDTEMTAAPSATTRSPSLAATATSSFAPPSHDRPRVVE
jgi:hypothetical protein